MELKMGHNHSFTGLIFTGISWICMKLFLLIHWVTIAEFSSFCVILGTIWTIIANADKAVDNINKFNTWLQKYKKLK